MNTKNSDKEIGETLVVTCTICGELARKLFTTFKTGENFPPGIFTPRGGPVVWAFERQSGYFSLEDMQKFDIDYRVTLAKLLAKHGFKKLVFLSRSGCELKPKSDEETEWHMRILKFAAQEAREFIYALKDPNDEAGLCKELGISGDAVSVAIIETCYITFPHFITPAKIKLGTRAVIPDIIKYGQSLTID